VARTVPPLNRRALVGAALLLAAAAAGSVLLLRDDPAPAAVGDRFRISYDVVDRTTGRTVTEVHEVDRPLRSRWLTGDSGSATTETGVYDRADGAWRQLAVAPPGEVGQDLRLGAALRWAGDQGFAEQDGGTTVAGRPCTWWVTKEPLDVAAFAAATGEDRTRSCVDDSGLLLAEEWRAGGRDLRRRTATDVRALDRVDVFDGATPQPLAPGLLLTAVRPEQGPVSDLVALTPPPGLRWLTGASSSDLQPGTTDVLRRSVRAVYSVGDEVLVVDQVRGPLEARGTQVRLGQLGTGQVQATGGGLVVTVPLGAEQAVRVRSSLPYDVLVGWLSGLRRAQ
jgi:hypothetical protein